MPYDDARRPSPPTTANPSASARARFDVVMRPSGPELRLSGALDLASAPRLGGLLEALLRYPAVISVDAVGVDFADCAGVRPLVDASRPEDGRRHIRIARSSAAFRRVFVVLGVACEPHIDVAAWEDDTRGHATNFQRPSMRR